MYGKNKLKGRKVYFSKVEQVFIYLPLVSTLKKKVLLWQVLDFELTTVLYVIKSTESIKMWIFRNLEPVAVHRSLQNHLNVFKGLGYGIGERKNKSEQVPVNIILYHNVDP